MKEEIKSFLTKTLVVIFAIGILASVTYVCNFEKETNSGKVLNDIVYDDSTNVQPVIREITRPDECDSKTAYMAWSSIKDKKEFANCWYDSFSYDGIVENKISIMWIVCPKNMNGKLPDTLGTFILKEVWPKVDMIYGYICKWIDYSTIKETK